MGQAIECWACVHESVAHDLSRGSQYIVVCAAVLSRQQELVPASMQTPQQGWAAALASHRQAPRSKVPEQLAVGLLVARTRARAAKPAAQRGRINM